MKQPSDKDPIDILGRIYENLYEDSVAAFRNSEKKTSETLHVLIDEAGDLIAAAEELTSEQINEVSGYVKRDIDDLALFLSKTGNDLSDWLGFELELLETKVIDQLFEAVDPSTISLLSLKEQAATLHTGQITGPGVLTCDACGEQLHYYKAGRIPPCPKCRKTEYHRKSD